MAHVLTNGDYSVTVYGAFAPQYVRTDKNGTKIYNDINCPRCAGEGESDNWWATGKTCFKCGGTGKRATPLAVKVYTKEYWERLEARRAAKAAAEAEANAPAGLQICLGESVKEWPYEDLIAHVDIAKVAETVHVDPSRLTIITPQEYDERYGDKE